MSREAGNKGGKGPRTSQAGARNEGYKRLKLLALQSTAEKAR